MTTFSPNLLLAEPTPLDPATLDAWGATINTDLTLVDSAVAGILSLSVAGSSNVILTSNSGTADQSRNQAFKFTGILTGNIDVLWPNGLNRFFSVTNSTTGAFSLTLAVNNGSGSPAGATYAIAQGETSQFQSNGTDITLRGVASFFPAGTVMSFLQAAAPTGWTQSNSFNDKVIRLVDNTGTGGVSGGSWTISGVTIGGTSITQAELPNCSFTEAGGGHTHALKSWSGAGDNNSGSGSLSTSGSVPLYSSADGVNQNMSASMVQATSVTVLSGGSGTAHTHSFSNDAAWRPQFVNAIVCTKN